MSKVRSLIEKLKYPYHRFRKLRRRNKVIAIVALIILAMVINGYIQNLTAKPPYETQAAIKGDIVQIISETGNVSTGGRVDVFSSTTGIVEELYVANGDAVAVGQQLFKVRSSATDQEKASANATYQSAVSAQKTAEQGKLTADAAMWASHQSWIDARNLQKNKNDNNTNTATNKDYTDLEEESIDVAAVQAEKNFRALEKKVLEADVAITAARAQTQAASLNYQATINATTKATTQGTVANLSIAIGDNVQAGAPSSAGSTALSAAAGTPILTIANLTSNYSIRLALNEIDIPKVKQGQEATIVLDAFSGKKFNGAVTHVDAVGTNTQGIVTYNVLVAITKPDSNMKPGMTADVDIEVDRADNVLTVPNSAVKPYKGGRSVRVIDPKTKELKNIPVETGIKGDTRTEITKGISEGQEVVIAVANEQIKRNGPF